MKGRPLDFGGGGGENNNYFTFVTLINPRLIYIYVCVYIYIYILHFYIFTRIIFFNFRSVKSSFRVFKQNYLNEMFLKVPTQLMHFLLA